ncbi:amidoligase family protein [bacterium]|nr:amidoligase family protein [bacterium]
MRTLRFGVEIELVMISRERAAKAVQAVVGGAAAYRGYVDGLDTWVVDDARGRTWKIVSDASLTNAPAHLRVEVVTPILEWNDIAELQEVVRALRQTGGRVNDQCGVHVHVDGAPFDAAALARLVKIVNKQERLIIDALAVDEDRLRRYAKANSQEFVQKVSTQRVRSMRTLNRLWYGKHNGHPQHYDPSRYRGLNLHPLWYDQSFELRWFNGSNHAGVIRAYIVFSLALAAKALNSRAASASRREYDPNNTKFCFRVFLLHLSLSGDEFKNVRKHLMAHLTGSAAWRHGRPTKKGKGDGAEQEAR